MLYHKDVFMPRKIRGQVPTGVKRLNWSNHAARARNDKYGKIPEFDSLDFSACEVVEVEIYAKKVQKLVLRLTQTEKHVIFVVSPSVNDKTWTVRTVWINLVSDKHSTLDTTPYVKA